MRLPTKPRIGWIAALAVLAALSATGARAASDLDEIRDTQKKILDRLDAQEKILKDIQGKLQAVPSRPQIDPSKVYDLPVAHSPVRGPKNAKVTLVEFSDFQ